MISPLDQYPVLLKALHALQIIVIAMLVGVLLFSAFVLYRLVDGAEPLGDSTGMLTSILMVMSVATVGLTVVLRAKVLSSSLAKIAAGTWKPRARASAAGSALSPDAFQEAGTAGQLVQTRMLTTIIGCAGLEGAALLCLVAALFDTQPIALGAAGLWGLLLAFQIPTRRGMEHWLEAQMLKLPGE